MHGQMEHPMKCPIGYWKEIQLDNQMECLLSNGVLDSWSDGASNEVSNWVLERNLGGSLKRKSCHMTEA